MKKFLKTFGFVVLLGASTMLEAVLPSPACSPGDVGPDGTILVYDDLRNVSFTENIWGATVSATSDAFVGNSALKVDFKQGWSGIEFNGRTVYDPKIIGSVQIATKGSASGQNIRIYLLDKDGRKLGVDMDLSDYLVGGFTPDYQKAAIPLADLYKNTNQPIGGVGIQSENPTTIWIDDIKFVAPEPERLITLYGDHLHAKQHSWLSKATIETSNPFAGDKAVKLQINSAWGGLALYSDRPISEKDFGAITLAVKTNTNDIDLYVYAVNKDGDRVGLARPLSDFLYGGAIPKNWQVAWVDIQKFIPHPKPGTFVFHGIGIESTMPGTVWVDEVKMVEKLKWPLPSFPIGSFNGGYVFGEEWKEPKGKCGDDWMLHAARDFSVNGKSGENVVAAHNGTLRFSRIGTSGEYGGYVIIESLGNAFSTVYTHINPVFVQKDEHERKVKAGEKIGTTSPLPNLSPHLHFQLWVAPYSSKELDKLLSGVLPRTSCGGRPAFPEAFVDPAIEWPCSSCSF